MKIRPVAHTLSSMASIDVSTGVTLEYDIRGEGEPILFVMGLAGQLIDYPEDFVDLFVAEGFQVIRFDNRDSGLSTMTDWAPPGRLRTVLSLLTRRPLRGVGYTIDDMADDGAALLDALGLGSAHVVGMSMGGMIAQAMAIRHPATVASVCSIMSNPGDRRSGEATLSLVGKVARRPTPTRETAVEHSVFLLRAISGDHFDEDATRAMVVEDVARSYAPRGVARQAAVILGSPDRTEGLGRVTAPSLVIHGLQDPLVKPSGGIATVRAIPGARLLMFPDMGHDLPRPRWFEMRDAIVTNARRRALVRG